jgi:hypothetical protein
MLIRACAGEIFVRVVANKAAVGCSICENGRSDGPMGIGRGRRLVAALRREIGGAADWTFTETRTCVGLISPPGHSDGPFRP